MTPIEIVFFDAGETLLRPEPGVGEAYARAGRRYGLDADPAAIETYTAHEAVRRISLVERTLLLSQAILEFDPGPEPS